MGDELDRLAESSELRGLLETYVQAGELDRDAWIDRPMEWSGLRERALTKLHGELLAAGWLEVNLDSGTTRRADVVAGCYRATSAGVKAHRQVTN